MYLCILSISYSCTANDIQTNETNAAKRRVIEPRGLISPEPAVELNQNWHLTRVKAIEKALGRPDNQSVQFSLQKVCNYLDYSNNDAISLGYVMNGVRLYFGAYGQHEAQKNAGLATLFLVPTSSKA